MDESDPYDTGDKNWNSWSRLIVYQISEIKRIADALSDKVIHHEVKISQVDDLKVAVADLETSLSKLTLNVNTLQTQNRFWAIVFGVIAAAGATAIFQLMFYFITH
jgi:hypothetical protein